MYLGNNCLVWLSENENIAITKGHKGYFIMRSHIYGKRSIRFTIASFEKQSEAINYASKIADTSIKVC